MYYIDHHLVMTPNWRSVNPLKNTTQHVLKFMYVYINSKIFTFKIYTFSIQNETEQPPTIVVNCLFHELANFINVPDVCVHACKFVYTNILKDS